MHQHRTTIIRRAAFIALTVTFACSNLSANTVTDVEAATQQWIAAFNRHSTDEIVALYATDAVFFGTTSPVLRDTPALVRDYFKSMADHANSTIGMGEHRVQVFGDVAVNTGFYIRKTVEAGKVVESPARFTFVYQLRAGKWMIVDHHSSALP